MDPVACDPNFYSSTSRGTVDVRVLYSTRWLWLQHPSKDDEACAIYGKRTTSNSKLNTSIRCGVRRGADFVIFQQYQRVIPGCKSYRGRSAISIIPGRSQARARGNRSCTVLVTRFGRFGLVQYSFVLHHAVPSWLDHTAANEFAASIEAFSKVVNSKYVHRLEIRDKMSRPCSQSDRSSRSFSEIDLFGSNARRGAPEFPGGRAGKSSTKTQTSDSQLRTCRSLNDSPRGKAAPTPRFSVGSSSSKLATFFPPGLLARYEVPSSISDELHYAGGNMENPRRQIQVIGEGGRRFQCRILDLNPMDAHGVDRLQDMSLAPANVVRKLKRLRHPSLVRVRDVFLSDVERKAFLVIETPGSEGGTETLKDRLKRPGQFFLEDEARMIIKQVLSAVSVMHTCCMSHGFLSPDSILLSERFDGSFDVAVNGVGLSSFLPLGETSGGRNLNQAWTPHRSPPEMLMTLRETMGSECDPDNSLRKGNTSSGEETKVDSWACGVLLYELLSGTTPFVGGNGGLYGQMQALQRHDFQFSDTIWREISDSGKELVRLLLHPDPQERLGVTEALQHRWFSDNVY